MKLPAYRPKKGSLWIHALSVGEVLSAVPLLKAMHRRYPQKDIILTVTTRQGMEVAQREATEYVAALFTMPMDFWWTTRRLVRYVRPAIFLLVETDIWPGLINNLKKRNISTVMVNCRISPRTHKSYSRFRRIVRLMYQPMERCLVQTELDMRRLMSAGVDAAKISVSGNIKFDREWADMEDGERKSWLERLRIDPRDEVWVAGSTHEGEEDIVLEAFRSLRNGFPRLRLIIAPRRIERSAEVEKLSTERGFRTLLRTELMHHMESYDVLVLDTLGELERIYGIASVSFVGGSLVPEGGHNLLEPASFGCPVLFGPHTEDFELMARSLEESGGGRLVEGLEGLLREMGRLLSSPEETRSMGKAARAFVQRNRGAIDRVMAEIVSLIPPAD
ncbi:MAG: 3-deoxy-D-manno-octulosonic acid transferase [Deltaproteobacteria bacterium]|nr:3-deoxy-D-manno-octulosonic acid transferase [Deltaproteobacteria bacterium]